MVKLGFGLYAHQLTDEGFAFARQCGATHLVVHLVDYFNGIEETGRDNQPVGGSGGWGIAGKNRALWTTKALKELVERAAAYGLTIEAIENFDPADWYDVLLAGPRRDEQLDELRKKIAAVGEAGISTIGYNFSIAGVASRVSAPYARGNAISVGMDAVDRSPIPQGMVWNMVYDFALYNASIERGAYHREIDHDELWRRLAYFLNAVLPAAESAGVTLALHPDDPPAPVVRRQPRLVWRADLYDRVLDISPSPANKLELCLGTLAEMPGHDLTETVRRYAARGAIGYIHLRNVTGTVPTYRETFIDDGDIDVHAVMEVLADEGFDGIVIPDHTPLMSCPAPWHSGMAYAAGYIKCAIDSVERYR